MKFYRISLRSDGSDGFLWETNQKIAEQRAAEFLRLVEDAEAEIDVVEIAPTKTDILRALRKYADHPDNG